MASVRYPESGAAYKAARTAAVVGGRKVSQERLAEAAGVDPRHYKRIERGENRPRPELRDRIADFLEVDPASLPAAGEDPFVSDEMGSLALSPPGFFRRSVEWFRRR